MALQSGQTLAGSGCELVSPVVVESSHEVWRARRAAEGDVLVVAYPGSEGAALLAGCRAGLSRWQTVAASGNCPELLRILQLVEGEIPHLVVENGGATLRETYAAGPRDPRDIGRTALEAARCLVMARTFELYFVGLTPDNLVAAGPGTTELPPWRLLPIAPNAKFPVGAAGDYAPPELAEGAAAQELCPDTHALAWIIVELFAGTWLLPRRKESLATILPYPRLRMVLTNNLTPARGSYGDPKLLQVALDRWVRVESADDLREVAEARAAEGRTPAQAWLHKNRQLLIYAGGGLAALLLLLAMVFALPRLFIARNTTRTPYGLVNLFVGEMVDRDVAGAAGLATGEATPQVARLMEEITNMERSNLASRFSRGTPQVAGDGEARNVKLDLFGANGDLFMKAEMTIRQRRDGEWRIEKLFFEPVRTE